MASCTHVFAPLARGKLLDDKNVQCPLHRARFDIRSGKVADWANFPPGIQMLNVVRSEKALRTFKVVVEGDSVKSMSRNKKSLSGKYFKIGLSRRSRARRVTMSVSPEVGFNP